MKERLRYLFSNLKKDYITFSDLKRYFKISKKKDNYEEKVTELKSALDELVASKELKCDELNRYYVTDLPKKASVSSRILAIIKENANLTLNELQTKLSDVSKDEISTTLYELQLDGKIYNVAPNYYIPFPSNFFITTIYCTKKGIKYINHKGKTIFLNGEEYDSYLPFDLVVFAIHNKNFIPQQILKRENKEAICEIVIINGKKGIKLVGNNSFPIYLSLESLAKQNLKLSDLVVGTRILVTIELEKFSGKYKGNFQKIIGHKDDLDAELLAIGYNNGFKILYTEEELEQVRNTPTTLLEEDYQDRINLCHERIFTIDDESTKDMDDAIGIKKLENGDYLLNVSIADVAHYIKPNTPLWKRAENNTTSLYLINGVSHMLHTKISNGICSLNPGVPRLAKTFFIRINPSGYIVDFSFVNSVINSQKKMSYQKVNEILENNSVPEGYEEFVPDLQLMQELSHILSNRHQQDGAIDFDSSEIHFILDDEHHITDIQTKKQKAAEKIIENFMVITNEGMANFMLDRTLTFVYRNHELPFKDKVAETLHLIESTGCRLESIKNCDNPQVIQKIIRTLSTKEEFFILSSLLLKSMQKAHYSTQNKGHYALALNAYSQTTSPIRRFLDLIIQTILDNLSKIYDGSLDINELENYLIESCAKANMMEINANKAEYEANKLYMIDYINSKKDEIFTAYVADITSKYIVIKLPNLIEGIMYFDDLTSNSDEKYTFNPKNKWLTNQAGHNIVIGSKLDVLVKECDRENRIIYFKAANLKREISTSLTRTKK